jgi:hypothetical protein
MAGQPLTIKLTTDQQKLIKDATGQSITELNMDAATARALSEKELDNVAGGISFHVQTGEE